MFKNFFSRLSPHAPHEVWGRPLSLALVVLYKGLFGLVEVVFGGALVAVTLWFTNPNSHHFINQLIASELAETPRDAFVSWILTHNLPISPSMALQFGVLVLVLGILKLLVAAGIWYRSPAARVATMVLVAALGLFGVVELWYNFDWFKFGTVIIDAALFYYLWRVLPKYLVHHGGVDTFAAMR